MPIVTLQSLTPLSFIGVQAKMVLASPLFMTFDLLGEKIYECAGLLSESSLSRENMKQLIRTRKELMETKETQKNEQTSWYKKLSGLPMQVGAVYRKVL